MSYEGGVRYSSSHRYPGGLSYVSIQTFHSLIMVRWNDRWWICSTSVLLRNFTKNNTRGYQVDCSINDCTNLPQKVYLNYTFGTMKFQPHQVSMSSSNPTLHPMSISNYPIQQTKTLICWLVLNRPLVAHVFVMSVERRTVHCWFAHHYQHSPVYDGNLIPWSLPDTLRETNIAPENWWLEDYFPFGTQPISREYVSFSFREGKFPNFQPLNAVENDTSTFPPIPSWRIIPVSKWLVPIYKPLFRPFGKGINPVTDLPTMVHGY